MTKSTKDSFGCAKCWPESPEEANEGRRRLFLIAELIDESHFGVSIRACSVCAQKFLSVFTELVDWTDGDDPQYWTLLPVTEAEASKLIDAAESLTETMINSLGQNRRCLQTDYPKGQTKRVNWGTGFFVGPHD